MPFPTELPTPALHELAGVFTGGDKDPSRVALSVYELTGYGLFLAFGDAKYLMTASPEQILAAEKMRASLDPKFLETLKDLPWAEIAAFIGTGIAAGTNPYLLAALVLFKYGYKLLPVIEQLIAVIKAAKGH